LAAKGYSINTSNHTRDLHFNLAGGESSCAFLSTACDTRDIGLCIRVTDESEPLGQTFQCSSKVQFLHLERKKCSWWYRLRPAVLCTLLDVQYV